MGVCKHVENEFSKYCICQNYDEIMTFMLSLRFELDVCFKLKDDELWQHLLPRTLHVEVS